LLLNKLRGVLNVVAVKAPGFGDKKKSNARRYSYFNRWRQLSLLMLGLELKRYNN
jgi:hypothetical protein